MRGIWRKYLAPQAALIVLAAAVAYAENPKNAAVSRKALEDKRSYCLTCHGLRGEGFRGPFLPMPRLAGQQSEYIEHQLKAFSDGRRAGPFMGGVARALRPEMVKALSKSFQGLDPAPLGGGSKALASEGRNIYENGVQSANVPPCATCHGPEAKGDGQIPRLAGQLNDFIFKMLSNWKNERGQNPADPNTSAIMHPSAQNLTPHQIAAVAAYVSHLK